MRIDRYQKPARPLKILIGCEHSGVIRDAFTQRGHIAYSCDLLPSDKPGRHIQGNLLEVLNDGWDMLIAHPDCTYLSVSGMHRTARGLRDLQLTLDAVEFANYLIDHPDIKRVGVENPISVLSSYVRKPDQIIQPYEFGHDYSKSTCLWLKGLPKLKGTKYYPPRITKSGRKRWGNQTDSGQNIEGPSDIRWKIRSKTFEGIADAMAEQWLGDSGWRPVILQSDLSEDCNNCQGVVGFCECILPNTDGYEYKVFHGVTMAKAA